ncbi:MAG TPA: hypothetical protein VFS23_41555, partial [Vicinamibacterales bacterium]|nr:hypothetical protein [Vicinamibacterales bacterium]
MAWTLDLGPLVRLQKRMWRAAFFTGFGVYFEAVVTLVLVINQQFSLLALAVANVIVFIQAVLIYRPARQLVRGELVRRYRSFILLAPAFVAITSIGSPAGEERQAAAILSALVAAMGVWAAIGAIRVARDFRPQLAQVREKTVLEDALSFSPFEALKARWRSFGGERRRWALPFVAAVGSFTAVAAVIAALTQAIGVNIGCSP